MWRLARFRVPASVTISTPLGLELTAILALRSKRAGASENVYVRPVDVTDQAPSISAAPLIFAYNAATGDGLDSILGDFRVRTNTSSQVAARADAASTEFDIVTRGWIDTRGRLS